MSSLPTSINEECYTWRSPIQCGTDSESHLLAERGKSVSIWCHELVCTESSNNSTKSPEQD